MEPNAPVSIITPTYGRAELLPLAYRMYTSQQDSAAREWIVIDDSPQPSPFMQSLADPDVRYLYLPQRRTTGEKRNLAIDAARGDIIVQFDDDDYYAPPYLKTMLHLMQSQQADFVKLSAFFVYSFVHQKFGYWDMQSKTGLHFWWKNEKTTILDTPKGLDGIEFGFGFSYMFRKEVWQRSPFPEVTCNEDSKFIRLAVRNGYKVTLAKDEGANCGLCLRLLHRYNTTSGLSQYVLPEFLARRLFPGFFGMLPEYTAAVPLITGTGRV